MHCFNHELCHCTALVTSHNTEGFSQCFNHELCHCTGDVKGNMLGGFSANQHGSMPLDYDDGTEFMNSVDNVLVYGGFKACWHSARFRTEFLHSRMSLFPHLL